LEHAETIKLLVRPDDWVVVGFDDISVLWLAFWGNNSKVLLLPASTSAQASSWLDSAKNSAVHGPGRLLFIGVLDQGQVAWDAFLGNRVGIPFSLLDEYRKQAAILARFPFGSEELTVRSYE
jgi:hypothetical protein